MTDANRTQMVQDTNKTMLGGPPVDLNKTIMGVGPNANLNLTQTIKPVQCPVCKTFNPPGMIYCVDCGLIFEKALDGDAFGAPAVQVPILIDETGREYPVRPGENVIGREGDVLIDDGRISRRHASITSSPTGLTLQDLGSTNGTKLNGQAVTSQQALTGGEKISLGGFELVLQMPGAAASSHATQQFASNKTAAMMTAPRTASAAAYLVGEGSRFPLKPGMSHFGRKAENDVCIADPYVSGKHGLIEVTPEGFFLTDTGSSNGTSVNNAKLVPNMRTAVGPEDEIQLGSMTFQLESGDSNGGQA